jgi:hypothetical protein
MSTRTPTVRQMGPRKRTPAEQVGEEQRPQPRVRVEQTTKPGGPAREYAPKVFEGGPRGGEVPVEASDVEDAPRGPAVAADRQDGGGPIVAESNRVIGKGGVAPAARRAPAGTPAGGARRGPPRAQWMGSDGAAQDMVVVEAQQRQEGTVHPDQIIHREEPGPATPTGEPCTCVYEWELDEANNEISVWIKEHPGLASSMRGAPRWMTWCVVCGGERDGQFRPENAIRYGGMVAEPAPAFDVQQVTGSVVEQVMDQVAGYLGSEGFLDGLSERIAAKMTPPPIPEG